MRRNHIKKTHRKEDNYILDYIMLPEHPEISHIIVDPMRTIYKNISASDEAMYMPVIKSNDDPAMWLIAGKI